MQVSSPAGRGHRASVMGLQSWELEMWGLSPLLWSLSFFHPAEPGQGTLGNSMVVPWCSSLWGHRVENDRWGWYAMPAERRQSHQPPAERGTVLGSPWA